MTQVIPGLIGTIYLVNGDEVSMTESMLTSKRKATRAARRIKRKGCWITYETGDQEFVFPGDIKSIQLCRRATLQVTAGEEAAWNL